MSILSDHITECPACHTEIGVACTDVAEADRLRAENAALRERLRRIRDAIPRGDDTDESGERLHNYSRVSEATVRRCEEYADLRKWRVLHPKRSRR